MEMKRLTLIIVLLAFCTQCTERVPPSKADGVEKTNTSSTLVQKSKKMSLFPQRESGAQKAYMDPETGQFINPPIHDVPVPNEPIEASAFRSSVDNMEEKSSPVHGGGMMIDLKGRFQSPITVTIEGKGKTKIKHQTNDKME